MTKTKPLVAKGKVSKAWQVVFCFLSPLDIWGFYRIEKLRKAILYIAIPHIIIASVLFVVIDGDFVIGNMSMEHLLASPVFYAEVIMSVFLAWAICLILRWSNEWNKNFDSQT